MNTASTRPIFSIAIAIVLFSRSLAVTQAAEYAVAIQGEITQVTDDLNWFHDSIQVGMPVEGGYNFFDPGYLKQTYVGDHFAGHLPILFPAGRQFQCSRAAGEHAFGYWRP